MTADNQDGFKENSFGVKLKRYGQVSGSVATLAATLAGEKYLGRAIERGDHAEELKAVLGKLKGPLMKVGQILATIPEALPKEYADAFQELQCNAPPMGRSFMRRRMKAELGADWQDLFQEFGDEAAAAASLGQVHKAMTKSGDTVACKLQYPDMQSAIEADLAQLKMLSKVYRMYDQSIDPRHIHQELEERLLEELDYDREARQMQLYSYMLRDEPNVHVPDFVPELSTGRLLTAKWLDGNKILSYKDAAPEVRNTLAMNMFKAWYVPLYHYGVIHGDPHLGNYTVRDDLGINLLDFGCIRVFPPSFIKGVIDLYHALQNGDDELAAHAYQTWGFEGLTKAHIETLNIWARFLYSPILEDKVRPIGEVTNGIYGREIAEKVHKELRALGSVTPPREFVFMDRAALGLGSVFLHLRAEINWYQVFNGLIDGFDVDDLTARQNQALSKFGLA